MPADRNDPWFEYDSEYERAVGCGVAGWSDSNPVARAARER